MKGKNPSLLHSYTYEVTFGSGTLGINLQTTRSGKGAYVDSFYRPPENIALPAEQSGYIKLGDLILEINGDDVSGLSLIELPKVIEKAKRPVTIKFERANMELEFLDVVRDPRKLPWFMQFIVDKYGIEEAVQEQAKLMLWLECEQFVENELNVPDGDYRDQAHMILRKFFRPDSNFSLLLHAPEEVRSAMLIALAAAEEGTGEWGSQGGRSGTPVPAPGTPSGLAGGGGNARHELYREAQRWAERDMKNGSFLHFCSSMMGARMIGHLRYSPPFVRIHLQELLACDKKSVFLLLHLCQAKRHGILHCFNLLRQRPEDSIEGGVPATEDMLRTAAGCVEVLGLQDGRSGVEDLPMLNRLAQLLPEAVQHSTRLTSPAVEGSFGIGHTSGASYLDRLQGEVTLSVPLSDHLRSLARSASDRNVEIIAEVRQCLRSLRTSILRELSTEIVPKFFASNEFEILLWELDAHRKYLVEENRRKRMDDAGVSPDSPSSYDDDLEEDAELARSYGRMMNGRSPGQNGTDNGAERGTGAEVPDGAVQRLIRKLAPTLPSTITMHRAPLDVLDGAQEEREMLQEEPMAWLLAFGTEGGRLLNSGSSSDTPAATSSPPLESVKVLATIPLPADKKSTLKSWDCSNIIPDSIVSFVVPSGRCAYECPTKNAGGKDHTAVPSPSLFNLALTTRDNALMYGCALSTHRAVSVMVPEPPVHLLANDVDSKEGGISSDIGHFSGRGARGTSTPASHPPAAIHRAHRPPPHTPKSSFKPLPSPSISAARTPHAPTATRSSLKASTTTAATKQSGGRAGGIYGDWIGQMSSGIESSLKSHSSPFLDRFKGGISSIGGAVSAATTPVHNKVPPTELSSLRSDTKKLDKILAKYTENSTVQSDTASSARGDLPPDTSSSQSNEATNQSVVVQGNDLPTPANIAECPSALSTEKEKCATPPPAIDDVKTTEDLPDTTSNTAMRFTELHVSEGLCLLTRVPCVDALRLPLTKLASEISLDKGLFTCNDGGAVALEYDKDSVVSQVRSLVECFDDGVDDSMQALRDAYAHFNSSLRVPAVMRWGGAQDFNMNMILRTLTPKNFVTILIAFILEHKIAVISSKLTVLTAMGELLKCLIAPLRWSHVYVPLLPKQFNNDILQCPTPFYVGIQRELFDPAATPADVIILDIDSDACKITTDLAKALYAGRRLAKALEHVMRPSLCSCDDIQVTLSDGHKGYNQGSTDERDTVREVLRLCKLFVADMLVGSEECCTYAVDHDELVVLFDEAMFSGYKRRRSLSDITLFPLDHAFNSQLMRTQCFSLCVVGSILKKIDPSSRPPSRPSSPFVSIPAPPTPTGSDGLPTTPVQYS